MSESSVTLKEKTRRFFEDVFPRADADGAADLVHEDVFDHSSPPGAPQGLDDVTRTMRWLNSVFSELRWEIHQMVAEGDTVVVHCTLHGRQTGDLMGIPPTGREVHQPYIQILRYEDGKAKERWAVRDDLTLMRQLGVMPVQPSNGQGG
ncbi:MAG TPA: ester cyclase [Acidimicrobiia bacterium]|nr:ester cyclase [Acidimicrobiia bacterium]